MTKYIMGVDAGTTSARTLILDEECNILTVAQKEITQHYPGPGWVEHDPNELLSTQLETMRMALEQAKLNPKDLFAVSFTNQRETAMVWDEKPVGRSITPLFGRPAKPSQSLSVGQRLV